MSFPEIYSFISSVFEPRALQKGPWPEGRPLGITVHHTADRDLERVLQDGPHRLVGYHLVIDRAGLVHQTAYMDQRVDHAGDADWNGHSPNRHFIAVAILSWGRVVRTGAGMAVWAKGQPLLPESDCALRPGNLDKIPAWWDSATAAQEETLLQVLRWLCAHGINPNNVCGHDECALPRGRKDDPGGTLATSMGEIRKRLASPMIRA